MARRSSASEHTLSMEVAKAPSKKSQPKIPTKKSRGASANEKRLSHCYAEQLRERTVARVNTFKQYGLNLDHVGIGVDDIDGDMIDIFLEISSTDEFFRQDRMLALKANCYDMNDVLISMDETYMYLDKFSGYNTYRISIWRKRIAKNTKRIVIYTAE